MEFTELCKQRHSVRDFSDKAIEDEKLSLILEAGRLAPTACNKQPQRLFVIKSDEGLEKVRKATPMAKNAPVVILVCYDKNESWKAAKYGDDFDSGEMDASIVVSAMMMQATELGIGSLWVRGYSSETIKTAFDLPDNIVPVCILDLGYERSAASNKTDRLPISDTVKFI